MSDFRIEFNKIHGLSTFDKHFVRRPEDFTPFINALPQANSVPHQISEKSDNFNFPRKSLVEVLLSQYRNIDCLSTKNKQLIQAINSPDTFTIITAHQPSLLTGPLYFIHKILSAIVTAESIQENIPDKTIIPLFIIGGEDHDFEEMNHLYYKGNRYEWNSDDVGGAVGRINTDGIKRVVEELSSSLEKTFYGNQVLEYLRNSFDGNRTVGEAVQHFLAHLFESESLLIAQMDNPIFKKAFVPYILDEVLNEKSKTPVEEMQVELESMGYGNQALAGEINFFYLHEGKRSRIVRSDASYHILDTEIKFSREEIEKHIQDYPDRFSPNVIMRPIYQEFIFPNLAYVGGGGELAYWVERKKQFEAFNLTFPLLLRRHSATIIPENKMENMSSLPISLEQWFSHLHDIENVWIDEDFSEELDFSKSYDKVHQAFDDLRERMTKLDESLQYSTEAARVDALKPLRRLENKMRRAIKKQEHEKRRQIKEIHEEFYPEGKLQERQLNVMEFYEKRGPQLFEDLKRAFTPFSPEMVVITEP